MKVAIWHNLPSGGGKRALTGHVSGLLAHGHQVEAWCPETADAAYLPLSRLIPEHRLPFAYPPPRRSLAAKIRRPFPGDPVLAEMDRHSRACAEAIVQGGFDLVFAAPCLFYRVPRLGHFLKGRGLPQVLYLQEPFRWYYEALPELPWLAPNPVTGESLPRWAMGKIADYRRLEAVRAGGRRELEDAKCYDRILVNSYFSRESVARAYGLDARVCYLGYDAARFHRLEPAPAKEDFIIGLGSLDYIKGVDTAIRAVGCLPKPGMRLLWVANSGDAAFGREMETLAGQLGVDFEVRRRIPDEELAGLLARARLLLYTSRLEPFGYAPVEANACGLPVVAVAEGGVRETVADGVNGLLCDRDPAALARAMTQLLADPALAEALGREGQRLAARFSPEQSARSIEEHLRAVLGGGDPALAKRPRRS